MTKEIVDDPKKDTTHYGDRPDNRETPPTVEVEDKHTEGSEHHPARHGRQTKSLIDQAIELNDRIEELKQDISKEMKKGNLSEAQKLDKEFSEVVNEKEAIEETVSVNV